MDNLAVINVNVPIQISREYLKKMSKDMIRKDFELLRIQDCFLNIFSEADLFSNSSDELSSVQHCLELASGMVFEDSFEVFWGLVSDSSMALAFDYKRGNDDQISLIKENVDVFVELIFKSCEEESELKKQYLFIEGFCLSFPHLEATFLRRRRMELATAICSHMH